MCTGHTPILSDLHEFGSLENDTATVALLYHPNIHELKSPRAGELDLIVANWRNDPTATVALGQLHHSRMVDTARFGAADLVPWHVTLAGSPSPHDPKTRPRLNPHQDHSRAVYALGHRPRRRRRR